MEPYEAERDYSLSEELTAVIRISPDKHSRLVMNLRLGTMLSDFPLPLSLAIYENSNEASQFGKGCTLSHFLSFADYESSSPVLTDFFGEKYYYPHLFCPKSGTKLIKEENLLTIEDEDKNRIEYEKGKCLPLFIRQGYHDKDSASGIVHSFVYGQGGYLSRIDAGDGRYVTLEKQGSNMTSFVIFKNEAGDMVRTVSLYYDSDGRISQADISENIGLVSSYSFIRTQDSIEVRDNIRNVSSQFAIDGEKEVTGAVRKYGQNEDVATRLSIAFSSDGFFEEFGNGKKTFHTVFGKGLQISYDSEGTFSHSSFSYMNRCWFLTGQTIFDGRKDSLTERNILSDGCFRLFSEHRSGWRESIISGSGSINRYTATIEPEAYMAAMLSDNTALVYDDSGRGECLIMQTSSRTGPSRPHFISFFSRCERGGGYPTTCFFLVVETLFRGMVTKKTETGFDDKPTGKWIHHHMPLYLDGIPYDSIRISFRFLYGVKYMLTGISLTEDDCYVRYDYDRKGRLIRAISQKDRIGLGYKDGKVSSVWNSSSSISDSSGERRPEKTYGECGQSISLSYGKDGNVTERTETVGNFIRHKSETRSKGMILSSVGHDGLERSYAYDAESDLLTRFFCAGYEVTYEHRTVTESYVAYPEGIAFLCKWKSTELPVSFRTENENVSYSYDSFLSLTEVRIGDRTLAEMSWEDDTYEGGRRVSNEDGKSFAYDAKGRLTSVTENGRTLLTNKWDSLGRKTLSTDGTDRTQYGYRYGMSSPSFVKTEDTERNVVCDRSGTLLYAYEDDIMSFSDSAPYLAGGERLSGLLSMKQKGDMWVLFPDDQSTDLVKGEERLVAEFPESGMLPAPSVQQMEGIPYLASVGDLGRHVWYTMELSEKDGKTSFSFGTWYRFFPMDGDERVVFLSLRYKDEPIVTLLCEPAGDRHRVSLVIGNDYGNATRTSFAANILWTHVALSIVQQNGTCEAILCFQGKEQRLTFPNMLRTGDVSVHVGSQNSTLGKGFLFNGTITGLFVDTERALTYEEMLSLYEEQSTILVPGGMGVSSSWTMRTQTGDYIPLNRSLEGKDVIPCLLDGTPRYVYDPDRNRHVLFLCGLKVGYPLASTAKKSLAVKFRPLDMYREMNVMSLEDLSGTAVLSVATEDGRLYFKDGSGRHGISTEKKVLDGWNILSVILDTTSSGSLSIDVRLNNEDFHVNAEAAISQAAVLSIGGKDWPFVGMMSDLKSEAIDAPHPVQKDLLFSKSMKDPFSRPCVCVTTDGVNGIRNELNYFTAKQENSDKELTLDLPIGLDVRLDESGNRLLSETVSYDERRRISKIKFFDIPTEYFYDGHNRLIYIKHKTERFSYEYDKYGNIIKEKGVSKWAYDENCPVLLKKFDDMTIEYENGKMLPVRVSKYGSVKRAFSYQGGRLSSVYIDGTTMNYRYDSYERRTEKYSYGYSVRYIYRGGLLIGMRTGTKKIRFEYTCENRLFSMTVVDLTTRQEKKGYYVLSVHGDVIKIVDASGNDLVSYSYDAWGKAEMKSGGNDFASYNPFRYRGYVYDGETGYYLCGTRYYVPEWRRWLTPDSFEYLNTDCPSGLNPFCYCNNNPINYVDPTGHFAISIGLFLGLVSASFAIGFTSSVITQGFTYGWENVNGYTFLQAGIDGLFAAGSMALAYTGIGLAASMAIGGAAGFAQYSIDSVFHNDFSWSGALVSTGLGIFGGFMSGSGMQNAASIASNLDDVGWAGLDAILTANARYGTGRGFQATVNLWGSRLATSITKAMTRSFISSFVTTAIYLPFSYGMSYSMNTLGWE